MSGPNAEIPGSKAYDEVEVDGFDSEIVEGLFNTLTDALAVRARPTKRNRELGQLRTRLNLETCRVRRTTS